MVLVLQGEIVLQRRARVFRGVPRAFSEDVLDRSPEQFVSQRSTLLFAPLLQTAHHALEAIERSQCQIGVAWLDIPDCLMVLVLIHIAQNGALSH